MFNTLYQKLAALLFFLMIAIGVILFIILSYATDMYQQEVNQKLNRQLASQIVSEQHLLKDGAVNENALKGLFHSLMVINPSIEVYLLDAQGKIMAFSAPEEKIKRRQLNLGPIKAFLQQRPSAPLLGDDPRDWQRQKVFSAAPIFKGQQLQGYLYVILGGETYDSITQMIRESYSLRISFIGLGAALIIALLAGLLLFATLTRRITRLSTVMSNYLKSDASGGIVRYAVKASQGDEIELLGNNFNVMAERIDRQLEELKQNDAKRRELVANVSHDLRTPLTSLHGYLETLLLKEDSLSAEDRHRYLEIIISQSERLKLLITDLFELAKLDSVETLLSVEPFSLSELVQDVAQKYALLAQEKGIAFNTHFNRELPFVYGDIALIQRALENLIDNALRHTPEGGKISIELNNEQNNIRVRVSDTGCGITQQDIDRIFERFYQGNQTNRQSDQHSGLGLAITKKILSLHGSQISADSTPNVGTTFTFQLPVMQPH
jgi:two-component system OmpR family sensor kinase